MTARTARSSSTAKRSGAALVRVARDLSARLAASSFPDPVAYVYDPASYAREPYETYLARFGPGAKDVLLVGMNPGPFGMAQTGVPFGDVGFVRDWMGIRGKVGRPAREHPKRPIHGFECTRSEVSGSRLWGWAHERFGTAERFFERFFVANYCPLVFMEASGRNLTPDKLPARARTALFRACDEALRHTVEILAPDLVVGVGGFAAQRAREALGPGARVGSIPHPSPASPQANRGWAKLADRAFDALGVQLPG